MKKVILLVADVKNWAFDNIAQYLQMLLNADYNVRILYTEQYKTHKMLLEEINALKKIDCIHFFQRRYLKALMEYIAQNKLENKNGKVILETALTTGIPDHLYLDPASIIDYRALFSFVDNYYTTSNILHSLYSNISSYPAPWQEVIYDNIIMPETNPNFEDKPKLRISWVGNSAWGEWHFGKQYDAKGFHTVIKPALERLKADINIEVVIADGAVQKRSKQEIHELLANTDILLIAAHTEGTPLPLIEAMASGCAVVTSNSGIVSDVLPEIQKPFILPRDPQKFVEAIKKLDADRQLLKKIKIANYDSFQTIFLDDTFFKNKWMRLIESSIARAQEPARIAEKEKILDSLRANRSFVSKLETIILSNSQLKKVIKLLLNFRLFNWVIRHLYSFLKKTDNLTLDVQKQHNHLVEKILVIYPTTYPGVKHSTLTLFSDHSTLGIPIDSEYFHLTSSTMKKIVTIIEELGAKKIIFSGGGQAMFDAMTYLSKYRGQAKRQLYYIYHGSPAQWAELSHLQHFNFILNLYQQGVIEAVLTLKKGLEESLKKLGIKAYLLQNLVPVIDLPRGPISRSPTKLQIGLWSAYSTWIKNLYPQLTALATLKDEVSVHTNFQFTPNDQWIKGGMDLTPHPKLLAHNELMRLMANTDLTLYITNSECSPMIALESLSLGIPCLVGPTSGLYDSDEYLREMLTVEKVDCPLTISQKILHVRENLQEIKKRLPKFVEQYNKKAQQLKYDFFAACKENKS